MRSDLGISQPNEGRNTTTTSQTDSEFEMDIKPTQVVPGAGSTAEVGSGNDPDLLTTTSLNAQEKEKQHDLAAEGAPAINHEGDGDRLEYATGMRLVIIMATLCLSTLLIALDLVSSSYPT